MSVTDLYAQYNWFANNYPPAIQQAGDEFFLPGFQFILVGISKNINTLMDKDAYFVTKVRIDKLHDMFFRFSQKSIGIILDKVLGRAESKFNLNKLTDLEAKIITSFNDFLYNSISQFLIPAAPALKRTNFDLIHLTFLIKDIEKNECGKFIITLPEVLLQPEIVEKSEDKFSEYDFVSSSVDVSIKIGTTRFKLIDIKNIDIDDIVVFDNSDVNKMTLKFKDYEEDIKINPNLGLIIPFDNDGGDVEMAENLWDSIEVEMGAQFDTVKITLGELKDIEEGLVVDLTSIYDNKVTLSVEDKPIARGQLVIVNDRYGVKVDEVIAKDTNNKVDTQDSYDDNQEEIPEEVEETQETSDELPDEQAGDEEFDYSDFELEDEDI